MKPLSLQYNLFTLDSPSAEDLWRILQEKTQQRLRDVCREQANQNGINTANIFKSFVQRPVMKKVSKKKHDLLYIRQANEFHQDLTILLLNINPLDLENSQREQDFSRYLHSDPFRERSKFSSREWLQNRGHNNKTGNKLS
ncbi:Hypothetical predicted protein [Pelobates cultripes]|uniref:Uncharacterized protein n=1 Tax=Pelobates cultripes TaxID=61616 RepID=A0AAD1SYE4_PELCU|nr:Hypothetical predicted protein [Pelobates cultripes]